jgi:hypothetical protein
MRRDIHIAAVLLMAGASLAQAETNEDRIVRDLSRQGFRDIEIRREDGLMKVEAWRGSHELEITYDLSTGDIVKQEMEHHPGAPGLALGRPHDDEDDDRGRGRGRGRGGDDGRADDDDDRDDNGGGRGRGDSDDGPGDDNGGDRGDDDSDDGPGDDNGSDDNGGGRDGGGRGGRD